MWLLALAAGCRTRHTIADHHSFAAKRDVQSIRDVRTSHSVPVAGRMVVHQYGWCLLTGADGSLRESGLLVGKVSADYVPCSFTMCLSGLPRPVCIAPDDRDLDIDS